jgi:hypothetical protein
LSEFLDIVDFDRSVALEESRDNAQFGASLTVFDAFVRHVINCIFRSGKVNMHEDFSRAEKVKVSSNRSFGFIIGGVFFLIGFVPLLHAPHRPRWWAIVIAAVFSGCAQLCPDLLKSLNTFWVRFGLLLHKIVSPVILGLLFYTTVLPVGLLMRAFGKDPLRLNKDPAAASYWVLREPPGPSPESMTQQF